VGTSRASKILAPASRIDELDGAPIPYGSTPSSPNLQSGVLSFLAHPSHPCTPLFPLGLAHTPSYEAVPGMSWGGRPSTWRQRGAPRPKRGTDECIASSLTSLTGSRGKSCIVSGTSSLRALVPASLMSAALSTARSAGVAWSMGMKRGIFRGSAGTDSRRLVPMLGCCQEQKPSAPVTLKLWCSSVRSTSSRRTAKCILDRLLQVADGLEPDHLIVIDVMVVFEQSKVGQKCLLLGRQLCDDRLELLLNQRGDFCLEYIRQRARVSIWGQHFR